MSDPYALEDAVIASYELRGFDNNWPALMSLACLAARINKCVKVAESFYILH